MGFSVSGTFVLLLLGFFIAFGTFYGTVWDTMERVNDARAAQQEHLRRIQGTNVTITSVRISPDAVCGVTITANNTGELLLDLNETDLLFDNDYVADWHDETTVDGERTTLWHPGDQITITRNNLSAAPDRIKLVSGPGVADLKEVSELQC